MKYLKQLFLLLTEEIKPADPRDVGRHTVAMGGHGSCFWPHLAEHPRRPSIDLDRSGLEVEPQIPKQFVL